MINRKVVFLRDYDATAGGEIRWIGFRSPSITGEKKEFIWWSNFADTIDKGKKFCGALLSQWSIEAQIGPALDLNISLKSEKIHLLPKEKIDAGSEAITYGIYIESDRRVGFNFGMMVRGAEILENMKR